ncbi:MAG: bifunctional folylpolyglutamate synthase/dihydrofolate synthase [Prevotella sp.]|nr:bifunctional folylpolyglutamate synthase/dihydrofolate synthase [Prevotella sp.]
MTYEETTHYLFNQTANYEQQGAAGYKEGLDTMLALDEHLGHPHQHFRSIHVAGTNGKGSVCHLIAAILQICGYKVGLYTSPHIIDFSERIKVNGVPVPEDYVNQFVEQHRAFFEPLKPSFFEITTAMAFKYFEDMDVDIAVVEVGLGGRLDSTNIITPILSVITNISLDHTRLLGSSIEQIAVEKAGIIKEGVPVVIGESMPETRPLFEAIAMEHHAKIVFADDEENQRIIEANTQEDGMIHYRLKNHVEFHCELTGEFQPKNMNTTLCALSQLAEAGYLSSVGRDGNEKAGLEMDNAFQNVKKLTGLLARWQTVRENPTVICDMGHNPGAWDYLSHQLESIECNELRIVFGIAEDKDVYAILEKLPKNATYFFTKSTNHRALSEMSLKVFGEQFGLNCQSFPTVEEAYQAALQGASSDDVIFVGGSAYVVSDFLKTRI